MPLFEFGCPSCETVEEHYLPLASSADPNCERCGAATKRMISRFGIVFTGPITSKYNDKTLDGGHLEGHYAYTRDSKPVWIDSFQAQKEFCKQNGFINPKDIGPAEVSADGKSVSTRGLPGSW